MAQKLTSETSPDDLVESRIQSDDELWNAVYDQTNIRIPRVKVCENHVAPFKAFADAYFARYRNIVWHASRGFGGKSVLLATLAFMEGVEMGAAVNLLGGSGEQSQRVHGYMTGEDTNIPGTFWGHFGSPRHLLISDPSKRETRLTNGGRIVVLQASTRSVRGPHPQRLRLDEVDEVSMEIYQAASGQTMSARGIPAQTVLSSTHQYATGTFTEVLKIAGKKGWPVYEWCYRESAAGGWLAEDEIKGKRSDVTKTMWDTEYELQEPNPGARAIQPDTVNSMFDKTLGDVSGEMGREYIFEPPEKGAQYVHGADWARKNDFTVIVTFRTDTTPMRLVAFERTQKQAWPVMVAKLDKRIEFYGGDAVHDATGLGDVITGYLLSDVEPFIMVGRPRSELLSDYITAIEQGDIVCPLIDFMHSEHLYASVEDVYGGGTSAHLPDSISASALAYRAVSGRGWSRGMSG